MVEVNSSARLQRFQAVSRLLVQLLRHKAWLVRNKTLTDSSRQIRHLAGEIERKSYVVIPDYLSREACRELCLSIDRLLEKHAELVQVDAVGSDHRLFGSEHGGPTIARFHDDQFAKAVGETYLDHPLVCFTTLAARLNAGDGNHGSGQGWHRDALYVQYKAMIYLSDVDAQHGPFQILEGSHRMFSKLRDAWVGGLEPFNTRLKDTQVEALTTLSPLRLKTITAEAGAMILVDTSAVHRGMPIQDGVRYALTNYYYRPSEIVGRVENFPPKLSAKLS